MARMRLCVGLAMVAVAALALGCGGSDDEGSHSGGTNGGVGGAGGAGGTGGSGGSTGMTSQATSPGDLLVVDPGSGSILGVSPDGTVFTVLSAAAIRATTGAQAVNLDRKGIAVSPSSATAYFCEQESGSVVAFPVGGSASIVADRSEFVAATGGATDHFNLGIAFASDGLIYVTSNHDGPGEEDGGPGRDRVFQIDPSGGVTVAVEETQVESDLAGMVTSYDTEQAIVAGAGGSFFVANTNSGDPPGVLEFGSGGASPSVFNAGPGFSGNYSLRAMTLAPDGDVIVRDDEADKFLRVSSTGVTDFITQSVLDTAVLGADPDGGMAFADDGTFYVADDDFGILSFPPPYTSGTVFVDPSTIVATTGEPLSGFNLNGGIAFHP